MTLFELIDARWTPRVNQLKVRCPVCGYDMWHRADRWTVYCNCGTSGYVEGKIPPWKQE